MRKGQRSNCGGRVKGLIAAIKAHATSKKVCENVSEAILHLMRGSSERRAAVESAGFVPLLAAAFRTHKDKAKTWTHAALEHLGYEDNGKKKRALPKVHCA